VMLLDLQFLIGLALYAWLSPITQEAFRDIGAAMKSAGLRFCAIEHIFGMLIALALAHVCRARIRKADPYRRHRVAAIFFGLALVAMFASIPWPDTPNARPLLRLYMRCAFTLVAALAIAIGPQSSGRAATGRP